MSSLTNFFTSLANKIRSKTGSEATLTPYDMIDAIDDVYDEGVAHGETPTQTKSVTPSTSAQTVTPDSGYALSSVSVDAISPVHTGGTASVTLSGINSTAPFVYIPGGWYPQEHETYGTYVYMTTAQAQALHAHTGTYTFAANDTGGTKDLGEKHSYRYVNAANVYAKGKADGGIKITSLGSSNSLAARTFSATSITGYKSLTANNFFVNATGLYHYGNLENDGPTGAGAQTLSLTKSYNASTGVLTVSACTGTVYSTWAVKGATAYSQAYVNYTVYCAR